jgi:hypothetical protein
LAWHLETDTFKLQTALEWSTTAKHFINQYPKSIQIAASIDTVPLASSLFLAHIGWRTTSGQSLAYILIGEGQSKVHEIDPSLLGLNEWVILICTLPIVIGIVV